MKKSWKFCCASILLFSMIIVLILGCTDGTEPTKHLALSINPEQDSIAVGDTTEFTVHVNDATNLYGFHLEISFDSTKVEIPSDFLTIGDFWLDHLYLNDSFNIVASSLW